MKVFVLLLTALLSTHVSAIPTPRVFPRYVRRDENSTLLDLIAQYKQVKLQADQAEQTKHILLTEAQSKKLEIEKNIGFKNDSIISSSTSISAAKTPYSLVAETYTILTAVGSAVVYVNQGTARTVPLNPSSTVAPSSESAVPSRSDVSTVSPTSTGFTIPSYLSASLSPVPSSSASSAYACSTTSSLASSLTHTMPMAQANTILTRSGYATGQASQDSVAKMNIANDAPVTILVATGSAIVLASQGLTSTVNIASSPSQPPGSG